MVERARVSSRNESVEKFPIDSSMGIPGCETPLEGFQPSAFADAPVGFLIGPAWDSMRFTMALRSMNLLSEAIEKSVDRCEQEHWKNTFQLSQIQTKDTGYKAKQTIDSANLKL